MDTRKTGSLSAGLESVRQRFERWRRTRKPPSRIPEPLWAAAVRLVGRYGIHQTARALRVDYYSLKKRAGEALAVHRKFAPVSGSLSDDAAMTFVEVPSLTDHGFAAVPAACSECIVEWESATGAKMRVQLKGVTVPDLTALSRSFGDRRAPSGEWS
jgi:hypothetical protein